MCYFDRYLYEGCAVICILGGLVLTRNIAQVFMQKLLLFRATTAVLNQKISRVVIVELLLIPLTPSPLKIKPGSNISLMVGKLLSVFSH